MKNPIVRMTVTATATLLVIASSGCHGSGKSSPGFFFDGGMTDGGIEGDGASGDLGAVPDGLVMNASGPAIEVLLPKEGEIVVSDVITVRAKVTDRDGVEVQSIKMTLQGHEPAVMGLSTTEDVYESLADITGFSGAARLWVVARDLKGNENTTIRNFQRDPGPVIEFLSPADGSRHKGSVTVQVGATDRVAVTNFEVRIGVNPLKLTELPSNSAGRRIFATTVDFGDPMFGAPLSGQQVLTATAANAHGASTTTRETFYVDDQGPTITIKSHQPGDLIGGVFAVSAQIVDPAGVLPLSVRCLIGRRCDPAQHATNCDASGLTDTHEVDLSPSASDSNVFTGQFDTHSLANDLLWPVMSVRAADKLGNEAHTDIELGLDQGQPILELDPSNNVYKLRKKDGVIQCSWPFDPVGREAANDRYQVPQIVFLRARVEDQGNSSTVPSAPWVPIAGVDPATAFLFVLDNSATALVVDTDGDGKCDAINPKVIPASSVRQPGEAVAVNMAAIPVGGEANFRPWPDPVPYWPNPITNEYEWPIPADAARQAHAYCPDQLAGEGDDKQAPGLCMIEGSEFLPDKPQVISQTPNMSLAMPAIGLVGNVPAIWTIPPVGAGDALKCAGLPFDFRANGIGDGWVCVAASASDKLGNKGVAQPIRLWVVNGSTYRGPNLPPEAGTPPNCTGTLDPAKGNVDMAHPCSFRTWDSAPHFPQTFTKRAEAFIPSQ